MPMMQRMRPAPLHNSASLTAAPGNHAPAFTPSALLRTAFPGPCAQPLRLGKERPLLCHSAEPMCSAQKPRVPNPSPAPKGEGNRPSPENPCRTTGSAAFPDSGIGPGEAGVFLFCKCRFYS